jgi:hypothetical protein
MSTVTVIKPKATRVPKSADSITAGAMKLSLAERVELKKALELSITKEVNELKEAALTAEAVSKS